MIIGFGLQSAIGIAGLCLYMIAHALAKAGLFFVAGILLHRLRSMSETVLFARGRKLRFTPILWVLGRTCPGRDAAVRNLFGRIAGFSGWRRAGYG